MRCTSPCWLRGPGSVEAWPAEIGGCGFFSFLPQGSGSPYGSPRPPAGPERRTTREREPASSVPRAPGARLRW